MGMADQKDAPRCEKRIEAAKAGRKKFIPFKPCAKCRTSMRYTSTGGCVFCVNKWATEYQASIKAALKGE